MSCSFLKESSNPFSSYRMNWEAMWKARYEGFHLRDCLEYLHDIYDVYFTHCLFHFQVDLVKKAFQAMRVFLVKAANTKLPPKVREFYDKSK